MSTTTTTGIRIGGTGSESSDSVIQFAVPRRAKTAPKMLEVTASSSTMAEVAVALSTARRMPATVSLP